MITFNPGTAGDKRRHGLASFIAVVMFSVVAMGILALTALFQADTRRTQRHGVETQLRELLIAGGIAADHEWRASPPQAGEVSVHLPVRINDAGLTMQSTAAQTDEEHVIVSADVGTMHARQTLIYQRADAGWSLNRVKLDRLR